MLNNKL